MNKFIEYDIHNGITQIRCAIMNILDSLNKHEIHHYNFGIYISRTLIEECMGQCGWVIEENTYYSPSGKKFKFINESQLVEDTSVSEDLIEEAIYGLYPYGFTEDDICDIIFQIKDIYPTADINLITKLIKKYIHVRNS